MRNSFIIILSFILLISCNNTDYIPKYEDFENELEADYLQGRVKSFSQYKSDVIDSETGEKDETVIVMKKEYNEKGNITLLESYVYGKLDQKTTKTYRNNGSELEIIFESPSVPMRQVQINNIDTVTKKIASSKIIYNDSLIDEYSFFYDSYGNVIKTEQISNGKSSTQQSEYTYGKNGNILQRKITGTSDSEEEYEFLHEFKYDDKENKIEFVNKSNFFPEMKTVYEYDNKKRIVKITNYDISQIEKETSYDECNNIISERFYRNNTLNYEIQYTYEFDNTGNWIQRDAFVIESKEGKKTVPVYTESRVIEYY